MNTKLLRKVAKHILAEPKRLYMGYWVMVRRTQDESLRKFNENNEPVGNRPYAKCGTAACIAGWAKLLSGEEFDGSIGAARLLGIDVDERWDLFSHTQWPEQFRSKYKDDGSAASARVAAARIEHFIRTKGKE